MRTGLTKAEQLQLEQEKHIKIANTFFALAYWNIFILDVALILWAIDTYLF